MAYDKVKLQEERLKLLKKLEELFAEEIVALEERSDIKGLEIKLQTLAEHEQAIISQISSDFLLNRAKNLVKELSAPYREQLKQNKVKARFVGLILQLLDPETL